MQRKQKAEIDTGLRRLAEAGRDLSEVLEKGQAETPLSNHFTETLNRYQRENISVAVIGLSQSARTQALAWLLKQDPKLLNIQDNNMAGLIEIKLQSAGYSVESANGEKHEYEQFDSFIQALEAADLVQGGDENSWIDPLKLALPAEEKLKGLKILMPKNIEVFASSPQLLTRLFSETNSIIIAAEAAHQLSQPESEILSELLANTNLAVPLVIGAEDSDAKAWWKATPFQNAKLKLNPLVIDDERNDSSILTREDSELRNALLQTFYVSKFKNTIDALNDAKTNEIRLTNSRKKREENRGSASDKKLKSLDVQAEADKIKAFFNDELSNLSNALELRDKNAFRRSGSIAQDTDKIIDSLLFSDLQQETGLKEIRLSVPESVLTNLSSRIKNAYQKSLSDDLVFLRDGLDILKPALEEKLASLADEPVTLDIAKVSEGEIWQNLKSIFSLSVSYQGKMPKRGLLQRLGEGRKSVFGVLMLVTIVGMALGNNQLRSNRLLGLVIFLLFTGSIFYTYRSWAKEDKESAEMEISKVRDSVRSEVSRMLSEVQREKALAIRRSFDEIKKTLSRTIDNYMKMIRKRNTEQSESLRGKTQMNLRTIEKKLRDIQSMAQPVSRLEQQWRDLQRLSSQQLNDIVREMNKGAV